MFRSRLNFLNQQIRNPDQTGAIAESSAALTRVMIKTAELANKTCIVEIGPGTGVFTEAISRALIKDNPSTTFFALEINPEFAVTAQARCPNVAIYHDSAQNIGDYLQEGIYADCVISSLPWASLTPEDQIELLDSIYQALRTGGRFLTYTYVTSQFSKRAKQFRITLESTFSTVETTPIVWQNIPPAFVYACTK